MTIVDDDILTTDDLADGMHSARPAGHARPVRRVLSRLWRPAFGLGIAAAISVLVLRIGDRVEQFEMYGYPGVFVISLLGNATVILPAPSLAIVSVAGSILNPYLVGIFAGAGSALGELTGYLAGSSGRAVVQDRERYEQMVAWMQRHGLWVILVLSIIPNPLFDLAGIAAGALRIPVHQFLLACWAGKTIKTTIFALGGGALLVSLWGR
jgi:uncharacterized membrane protein YdjX (TVP38/TMEM64 family)